MKLTEDEAKTKLCPYKMTVPKGKIASGLYEGRYCEASHCMLWRWRNRSSAEEQAWKPEGARTTPVGFCGLSN